MLKIKEIEFIKDVVFKEMDFSYGGEIEYLSGNDVFVKYENNKAEINASNKTILSRGLMLLAKNIKEGKEHFKINQHPHFEKCGAHLDCSRNGVIKVPVLKRYLNQMSCLGMNTLFLYMEDTFEMKEYPYFGYMRGSYTIDELKSIDKYADSLGIEVVPSIQALGHMEQFLKWPEAAKFKDTKNVLLCDSEPTYELLENMIKTMRTAFTGSRLFIGMDEAEGMGRGAYLDKYGFQDQHEIFIRHLNRVSEICKKYNFKPILSADTFYEISTGSKHIYQLKELSKDKLANLPDMEYLCWGYDLKTQEEYEYFISCYKEMGDYVGEKTIYYGGIHTWYGILPTYNYCMERMEGALKACLNLKISEVIASYWGDDGTETNVGFTIPMLALYSEYCYLGESCTKEAVYDMMEAVSGFDTGTLDAISQSNMPVCVFDTDLDLSVTFLDLKRYGKRLFYGDLLYNTTGVLEAYKEYKQIYLKAAAALQGKNKKDKWFPYYDYAKRIYEILTVKADIITVIREKYNKKDIAYLRELSLNVLPDLIGKYRELLNRHQQIWLSTYKPFGWEVLNTRYGAVIARLEYAIERIANYCDGKIDKLEELEFDFIENAKLPLNGMRYYTVTYTSEFF